MRDGLDACLPARSLAHLHRCSQAFEIPQWVYNIETGCASNKITVWEWDARILNHQEICILHIERKKSDSNCQYCLQTYTMDKKKRSSSSATITTMKNIERSAKWRVSLTQIFTRSSWFPFGLWCVWFSWIEHKTSFIGSKDHKHTAIVVYECVCVCECNTTKQMCIKSINKQNCYWSNLVQLWLRCFFFSLSRQTNT